MLQAFRRPLMGLAVVTVIGLTVGVGIGVTTALLTDQQAPLSAIAWAQNGSNYTGTCETARDPNRAELGCTIVNEQTGRWGIYVLDFDQSATGEEALWQACFSSDTNSSQICKEGQGDLELP